MGPNDLNDVAPDSFKVCINHAATAPDYPSGPST